MTRGVFVTLEGGEGCGKSTQAARLVTALEAAGVDVRFLREPGGTVLGERLREILLDVRYAGMSPRAELLLYEAARAQLVDDVIGPALDAGAVVVCDRFYDSTTAYQGHARGLGAEAVRIHNAFATDGLVPDVTLVLDIDAAHGLVRAVGEGADRLESEALEFHERVRQGFLAIARDEPGRVRVIDATGTPDEVWERVAEALRGVPGVGSVLHSGAS